jgi:hypothetical protein
LLVAILGNVAGAVGGTLVGGLVKVGAELAAGVTSDALQAAANAATDGAVSKAEKARGLKRAKIFFVEAATMEAALATQLYKNWIDFLIASGDITVENLTFNEGLEMALQVKVATQLSQELAAGWARFLAQASLGAQGPRGKQLSNMDSYFGVEPSYQSPGVRSRAGTSGVFHVDVEILEDELYKEGAPRHVKVTTSVNDLNTEILHDIIRRANGKLGNIDVPKEVFVSRAEPSPADSPG